MNTASNPPHAHPIDPRSPRFGAAVTTVLLTVVLALDLTAGPTTQQAAWWLLVAITVLFAWGAVAGPAKHPYGLLFRTLIRPRLSPPAYREDPAGPRFAQLVGLVVSLAGVVLHAIGVPFGLTIAAAVAFMAAFLNAVFGLCLGCELHSMLLGLRTRHHTSPGRPTEASRW